jgi:hypothetical protein
LALGKEGKGTIFRRKNTRYLLYLPVHVLDYSMFPLKCSGSMPVNVHFSAKDDQVDCGEMDRRRNPNPPYIRDLFTNFI